MRDAKDEGSPGTRPGAGVTHSGAVRCSQAHRRTRYDAMRHGDAWSNVGRRRILSPSRLATFATPAPAVTADTAPLPRSSRAALLDSGATLRGNLREVRPPHTARPLLVHRLAEGRTIRTHRGIRRGARALTFDGVLLRARAMHAAGLLAGEDKGSWPAMWSTRDQVAFNLGRAQAKAGIA